MKILPLLLFGALLFPVKNAEALTLTQIRTEVRVLINDAASSTRQRFSDSQLNTWANEAQSILAARTDCVQDSYIFELVSGTTYYSLPSDFIKIKRVTWINRELPELTPAALGGRSSEWESQSGSPTYYYMNFSSRTKVGFAPFPNATTDTGTIKVDYIAFSDAMSANSDQPFNSLTDLVAYHYAVVYYMAYKALFADNRNQEMAVMFAQFDALAKIMGDKCRDLPNYLPSMTGRSQ